MSTEQLSAQQIVDTVLARMEAQGKPATGGLDSCLYRTTDGLKCAVGCLLTDEELDLLYEVGDNGRAVGEISLPPRLRPHLTLLSHLQWSHDQAAKGDRFFRDFKAGVAASAEFFDYTVPQDG